ncbi:MAG: glycosyltransferase family 87 protein [Chthoniobacteraceae bacterium]
MLFKVAVGLWVLSLVVICVRAFCDPTANTVTVPYSLASKAWWGGGRVYIGPGGMNYLPHFAIIFSLFDAMPAPFGEILWRVFAFALVTTGLWRFCRRLGGAAPHSDASGMNVSGGDVHEKNASGGDAYTSFFWVTLLTLPLSLAALRNGQANAVFGGMILHAVVSLDSKKWGWAAGWIVLSAAVKPLGIVLALLAPFVYRPLRWRMLLALAALVGFPFLFATPAYVMAQYHAFAGNLKVCAVVNDNSYADIGGVLRAFHVEMPPLLSKAVRVLGGGVTLMLWMWGSKWLRGPLRALWLLALTGSYLMLFNPMNEANSYVIMAPAFALWAVALLRGGECRRTGWAIVFITLSMGVLPSVLYPWLGNGFALVWHPVMTMVFVVLLVPVVMRLGEEKNDEG